MTLFQSLRTSLLGKTPLAMTILANGRLARVTMWYSACVLSYCLPNAAELPGRRVYMIKCDYGTMQTIFQVVARSLPAIAGQVFWRSFWQCPALLPLRSARIGTVFFANKVCTVKLK